MSEPNVHQLFSGLTYRNEPDIDIITWSNRQTPKNTWLFLAFVGSLIVTIPLAIFLTSLLFDDLYGQAGLRLGTGELLFSGFMVVASWVGVVAISYYLIRLSWTESIKISEDELSLHYSGLFSPKQRRFSSNQIWRLSFERVGNERDRESRFTLNVFDLNDKRHTLAYWIRDDENYQLFLLLNKIFDTRGWSVQGKSDYQPIRNWANRR